MNHKAATPSANATQTTVPTLALRGVSKTYGSSEAQVMALQPTDLEIYPGEFVVLVGPSGSGKSTLLTIAGLLQTPSAGEVTIQGTAVGALSARERDAMRLNTLGFVLQSNSLVPYLTVAEQFTLVDKVHPTGNLAQEQLAQLCTELGIAQLQQKLPEQLSGGQQQRVAIARALYPQPALILADEPTSALDSAAVETVTELFRRITTRQGVSVVAVTHDERVAQAADRVFEIHDGCLQERAAS